MAPTISNLFTDLAVLNNEASVETFFVNRLLTYLGYDDHHIRPKASLEQLQVNRGRRRESYRPDYGLLVGDGIRWICEAKGVEEDLDNWVGQCASYCLLLNQRHDDNPVEFFMLTNGVSTRIYKWDIDTPIVEVEFHQVQEGNERFERLRSLVSTAAIRQRVHQLDPEVDKLGLHRRSVAELNGDFAWAHRLIYRREALSYTAAFMEFVKLIFLKLLSDRRVHESSNLQIIDNVAFVPADEVQFSRRWIELREADTPNPLDRILFQELLQSFEADIATGRKKRIFEPGERLNLSADTIKALVDRFQKVDLISIDADLNGRMFETFLNSTLRGKALGQYFTPRSVVKLATRLARLEATPSHLDRVIDACCGTGGFLIEALADMWQQIDSNPALTNVQREALKSQVATQSLYGIDVARDPALARIARINMYLHGDGGSSIFQVDALDKQVRESTADTAEMKREKRELRDILAASSEGLADVALTNPPFAKFYSRDASAEATLLDDYELAFGSHGGSRRPLASVSSMILFLERYYDLLRPGGRLVTVIDESLLGSHTYKELRAWIRRRWLIRAVVSLPGDAFQRSQARVKTSVIVLEKRSSATQTQPAIFMYYCKAVGVDDPPRQRVLPVDETNRRLAADEIREVARLYDAYCNGRPEARDWTVDPMRATTRLDVKACLPEPARRADDWSEKGLEVVTLADLVEPISFDDVPDGSEPLRVIDVPNSDDEMVTYLRVTYDGSVEAGDEAWLSDVRVPRLMRVRQGDLVFSHINAIHGAVAVVPPEMAGFVVTNEYTVCRTRGGLDPRVVWAIVRAPEARADLLLLATGIGRTRIRWDEARHLRLPKPPAHVQEQIILQLDEADLARRRAAELMTTVRTYVDSTLLLDSPMANTIVAAFKPPR